MSSFNNYPLNGMFCGKNGNNFIKKISKRSLRLIYEIEGGTYEGLLESDESSSIHDNNIRTLPINVYKTY